MRAMTIPADSEAPRFTVKQHQYDTHLAHGKWSVHLDSRSGRGRFFGPLGNEGTFFVFGKVTVRADQFLPRQVIYALTEGGFDCAHYDVA